MTLVEEYGDEAIRDSSSLRGAVATKQSRNPRPSGPSGLLRRALPAMTIRREKAYCKDITKSVIVSLTRNPISQNYTVRGIKTSLRLAQSGALLLYNTAKATVFF
ncbi:MAG: hypothetical protein LBQ01_05955 [Prevotellaceae bacterium]|jgi:hypothetical protein|nr:hypothetical protein [Prevotellaceae bacterium]